MNLIVCLDDCGGMMFNRRRQSRDRRVIADILALIGRSRLWISPYSAVLFEETEECEARILAEEDFLQMAEKGDWCFVEDRSCAPFVTKMDKVVVYRWNRRYPADLLFDIDLQASGFCVVESKDFEGYSHETITREIFER